MEQFDLHEWTGTATDRLNGGGSSGESMQGLMGRSATRGGGDPGSKESRVIELGGSI
jgi:hypothetical protein